MLNKLIQNELEEIQEQTGFRVTDLDGANYCFRKLRALEEQRKEIESIVSQELSRIQSWEEKELGSIQSSTEYFEGLLKAYMFDLKRDNPKAKVSTPYGKITTRKASKWIYSDDEILGYLKENKPELIRIKEEINKAELKKFFKDGVNPETGEILPIEVLEEENITIKVEV